MPIVAQDFRFLLKKVEILDYKYSQLKQKDRFNIFMLLRNGTEEVELHSRFIGELLNPRGSHGKESSFLELFIYVVFSDSEKRPNFSNIENAHVTVEKHIGEISHHGTVGGRIDILVENIGATQIVIENKIYANDQTMAWCQVWSDEDIDSRYGNSGYAAGHRLVMQKSDVMRFLKRVNMDLIVRVYISQYAEKRYGNGEARDKKGWGVFTLRNSGRLETVGIRDETRGKVDQ